MKYNKLSHIQNMQDVEKFFDHIAKERKINFHPDNGFEDFMKYLSSYTSFAAGVSEEVDTKRKANVAMMISLFSEEIDVSAFDVYNFGIGYNELRYFSNDSDGNPLFESNNVHDWERGEDKFKIFEWEELTDYEKPAIEDILKQIIKTSWQHEMDS